jgi:hypothetical protein
LDSLAKKDSNQAMPQLSPEVNEIEEAEKVLANFEAP